MIDIKPMHAPDNEDFPYVCKVVIILKPNDTNNIESVDIVTRVEPPLICSNVSQSFIEITDELTTVSSLYWDADSSPCPTSCQVQVVVSFVNKQGYSRVVRKFEKIPLEMLFRGAEPVKDAKFKVTVSTNANMVDIAQLFKGLPAVIVQILGFHN